MYWLSSCQLKPHFFILFKKVFYCLHLAIKIHTFISYSANVLIHFASNLFYNSFTHRKITTTVC